MISAVFVYSWATLSCPDRNGDRCYNQINNRGVEFYRCLKDSSLFLCFSHSGSVSDLRAFWLLLLPLSSISSLVSAHSPFLFFIIDSFAPPALHFIHLPISPLWSTPHVYFLHFCCWNVKHPSRKIEGLWTFAIPPVFPLPSPLSSPPRWWDKYLLIHSQACNTGIFTCLFFSRGDAKEG